MPVRDATGALVRMLRQAFPDHELTFVNIHSRDWASGTLAAVRHRIALRLSGTDAHLACAAFLHGLDEREFDLGRYILADICVAVQHDAGGEVRLTVDALTIGND